MNRTDFHKLFKTPGPVVLPVIHVQDTDQTKRNIRIAVEEGAQGVLLINHDFPMENFLPILREVRSAFPLVWLGVNFLAVTGKEAFPILGHLSAQGVMIDAYWADDACIDERGDAESQSEASAITQARSRSGWEGLYLGGTAFKKQRDVNPDDYAAAAAIAGQHMDVVTTSGIATGKAADVGKVEVFRQACRDSPLAVASGVTPDNAADYAGMVDCFVVATGINHKGDFYNIDRMRLRRLMAICRKAGVPGEERESDRWYLPMMAPNIKGPTYAWLDPSTMYINSRSFHVLLDDLLAPFDAAEIDVVAGFDAMGFVLGAAMATLLGKGFLTIRKAGKLPVETSSVDFVNYSGRTQRLEMRIPAFKPGTRVLLVDQWIETGGTMEGGIALVEGQGGVVAGIAVVCVEETAQGPALRQKYKCSSAVLPETAIQEQCNRKTLDSFDSYQPECYLPD